MKKLFLLIAILGTYAGALAQDANPKFNKKLADSLGADEYGMKMYTMVILKSGPVKIEDKVVRDSIFRGHMNNIGRMAKMGKLVMAGPFETNDLKYRGIYIFNATLDETKQLVLSDPAVKAKVLDTEIFQWYGSAALLLTVDAHETLWTKKP